MGNSEVTLTKARRYEFTLRERITILGHVYWCYKSKGGFLRGERAARGRELRRLYSAMSWLVRPFIPSEATNTVKRRRHATELLFAMTKPMDSLNLTGALEPGVAETTFVAAFVVNAMKILDLYQRGLLMPPWHWVTSGKLTAIQVHQEALRTARGRGAPIWDRDSIANDAVYKFYRHQRFVREPLAYVRMITKRLCIDRRRALRHDEVSLDDAPEIAREDTPNLDVDRVDVLTLFVAWRSGYTGPQRGAAMIELELLWGIDAHEVQRMAMAACYPQDRAASVEKIRTELAKAQCSFRARNRKVDLAGQDDAIEALAKQRCNDGLRTAKKRAKENFRSYLSRRLGGNN
jgi:hypothetical protein